MWKLKTFLALFVVLKKIQKVSPCFKDGCPSMNGVLCKTDLECQDLKICRDASVCKGSFQKKKRRNIWKIPYLRGGGQRGSFSICYHGRFKMHRKSF